MKQIKPYILPVIVFIFVAFNLSMIQLKVDLTMLLFERLFKGGGWIEILIISTFGAFLAYQMQDPNKSGKWRRISWSIFAIWFFSQLALGIIVSDTFLLTGKLHLPVPAMLISGPIYRGEKSVMTMLFLSTIVLTGPAWCSQLCYFGALDNMLAKGKTKRGKIQNKFLLKNTILVSVIAATLILRIFNISALRATIMGGLFGILGIFVIVLFSRKQKRMIHCSVYCPIGTVVNYLHLINPFRLYIDSKCDLCMACTKHCKYDALNIQNIQRKKPGIGCTLCGDCISSCKSGSLKYKLFRFSPSKSRTIYLFLTISLYSIFMAMGRI